MTDTDPHDVIHRVAMNPGDPAIVCVGATSRDESPGEHPRSESKAKRKATDFSLSPIATASPWLTAKESAQYWKSSPRLIYREAAAGRLKVAYVGGRRELRTQKKWLDAALEAQAK